MSIAHELSCDVATAMLDGREDDQPVPHDEVLTDVVLEVHSTLRCLTGEARRSRLNREFFSQQCKAAATGGGTSSSGQH